MKALILAVILYGAPMANAKTPAKPVAPHATWNGKRFTCPKGTDIWADESEAIAGKPDYAYCVKPPKKVSARMTSKVYEAQYAMDQPEDDDYASLEDMEERQ